MVDDICNCSVHQSLQETSLLVSLSHLNVSYVL